MRTTTEKLASNSIRIQTSEFSQMLNLNNGLPPVVISDENSKPKTSTYCSESTDLCRESFLEGTKYHSCDSCRKSFTASSHLNTHVKTVHEDSKDHK